MDLFIYVSLVEITLTLIGFVALGAIGVRAVRRRKAAADADDTLGEDVPPMEYTGKMYPKSHPKTFGKSPDRK